jgi:D-3-phosphoglycerate dehydrogenase
MKVLISDTLSDAGLEIFRQAKGIEVLYEPDIHKDLEKFKTIIADIDGLAIRSGSKVTADLLAHAKKLKVIGRAGIGVDNVDIPAASKMGTIVMNTPGGNVVTTAEHAISMMCALTRQIPQATASIKAGKWEKNRFMGAELFNKILGIVGCGNIGKIVADRALGLKMKVIAFDPFLTAEIASELGIEKVELNDLFARADYITCHTPLNDKTKHIINKEAFAKMKKGVFIINCARGGIVKEDDLAAAIEAKIVAGAALDVFEKEPVDPSNPLLKLDQVICTPHLGAATEEAQENVALDVAQQIADFLINGNIVNALNAPNVSGELLKKLGAVITLSGKIGSLHGQLCKESPEEIRIAYYGDIIKHPLASLTTAILQGVLKPMMEEGSVNAVNAPYLAKDRGIKVQESKISSHSDYATLVEVTLKFKDSERVISGSIFGNASPRIVRFNNLFPEARPEGHILIVENQDKPGVIGKIGTYLGQHSVNISRMQLGLDEASGRATAFYNVASDVSEEILSGLRKIDGIIEATKVYL